MSDGFEVRTLAAFLPLPQGEREEAQAKLGKGEGDARKAPSLTPSSFRRYAPPSFSPEGRRI